MRINSCAALWVVDSKPALLLGPQVGSQRRPSVLPNEFSEQRRTHCSEPQTQLHHHSAAVHRRHSWVGHLAGKSADGQRDRLVHDLHRAAQPVFLKKLLFKRFQDIFEFPEQSLTTFKRLLCTESVFSSSVHQNQKMVADAGRTLRFHGLVLMLGIGMAALVARHGAVGPWCKSRAGDSTCCAGSREFSPLARPPVLTSPTVHLDLVRWQPVVTSADRRG